MTACTFTSFLLYAFTLRTRLERAMKLEWKREMPNKKVWGFGISQGCGLLLWLSHNIVACVKYLGGRGLYLAPK